VSCTHRSPLTIHLLNKNHCLEEDGKEFSSRRARRPANQKKLSGLSGERQNDKVLLQKTFSFLFILHESSFFKNIFKHSKEE